jgi:hypothetical protein
MSRPDRLRVAAGAAVLATVARVSSILLWPPNSDATHAQMLATAEAHRPAWALATLTETVAWLAAGFAVLTAMSLVSSRGWWPTRIGGWMYGSALLALGFVGTAMNGVTGVLATEPGRAAMVRVQDHLHGPSLDAAVAFVLLGELFALVFAVGLYRSGVVGWWFVAVSVAAEVGYVLTSDSSSHLVVLAGFAPLAVSWLTLARVMASARMPAVAPVPVAA